MALRRNICFLILLMGQGANAFFQMEIPQGFMWYKETPKPHKEKKQAEKTKTPQPKTAREKHVALNIAFEDAIHEALDDPTVENVKKAQRLQQTMVDKSETFSKAWMVASMDFDGIQDSDLSSNPLYLKLKAQEQEDQRQKIFSNLSKTYGVFYIFDEKCRYCHSFFPIVHKFCNTYGFEMIAVSRQGAKFDLDKSLSTKVTFLKDNGIIARLNTKGVFPSVFLADLKTESVIPISWGMSTLTELEENLERTVKYNQQLAEVRK